MPLPRPRSPAVPLWTLATVPTLPLSSPPPTTVVARMRSRLLTRTISTTALPTTSTSSPASSASSSLISATLRRMRSMPVTMPRLPLMGCRDRMLLMRSTMPLVFLLK